MSVHANGTRAKALRLSRGWNSDDVLLHSHLGVERLSKREIELGRPGRFTQRLKAKSRAGELAGLSKGTIYAVEAGKRVAFATLQILAETYGVDIRELTRANDLEPEDVDPLPALVADLKELTVRLHRLLDTVPRDERDEPDADSTDDETDDET